MTGRQGWRLGIGQTLLHCSLLALILLHAHCEIVQCDEASHPGLPADPAEIPLEGKSKSPAPPDKARLEQEIRTLSGEVTSLIREGKIDEAAATQRKVISCFEVLLGKIDPQTRNQKSLLSELEEVSKLSPEGQRDYVKARRKLAFGLMRMSVREYDKADELLQTAIETFRTAIGKDIISKATTLENLGIICLLREEPSTARDYFLQVVVTRKSTVGDDHPDCANALALVGGTYLEEEDFDKAEHYFREAFRRDRAVFGFRSIRCAEGLGRLSAAMIGKGRLTEAEAMSEQAIAIAEAIQTQNSPLIASYLFNLAKINIAYKDYGNAESCLRRSIQLYERHFPYQRMTARVYDRYAWLLRKLDRPDEAATMEARADLARTRK